LESSVIKGNPMTEFQIVTSGLQFPEGPVAMSDGSVLVVEIAGKKLTRVLPDGAHEVIAELDGGPNGAAIGPDGCCYICNSGGWVYRQDGELQITVGNAPENGWIERVDLDSGIATTLYRGTAEVALRSPNDIVFDAQGGFWFTDHGKRSERQLDRTGVFYAKADGSEIKEVIFPMLTPNGIGLSADGRELYVAETIGGRLWKFGVVAPGEVSCADPTTPHGGRLVAGLAGLNLLDSLAVDSAGNICIGTLFNGGITVISPDGSEVTHIPLPDRYVTNICFGGADLRTAYVTLSSSGRLVSLEWPRPGLPLNFQEGKPL
jgi:gluconolactonase